MIPTSAKLPADAGQRQECFEQAAAIFAAQGVHLTPEIMACMEPLLNGEMDYAAHEAMLLAMIDELTP